MNDAVLFAVAEHYKTLCSVYNLLHRSWLASDPHKQTNNVNIGCLWYHLRLLYDFRQHLCHSLREEMDTDCSQDLQRYFEITKDGQYSELWKLSNHMICQTYFLGIYLQYEHKTIQAPELVCHAVSSPQHAHTHTETHAAQNPVWARVWLQAPQNNLQS